RRPTVEELQDRAVRVGLLVVRVDPRVAEAAEDLVVAGIRELQAVGQRRGGLPRTVAEVLAVPGDRLPDEREQGLATFLGGSPPVATPQVVHVGNPPGLGVDQRLVRAGEELLVPKSVEGDDNNVLGPAWRPVPPRRTGDGQGREEADCDEESWRHESLRGR